MNNHQLEKKYRRASEAVLAVAAFVFWAFAHAGALAWQEQFQLFLFDIDYLAERLARPGGTAAWLAEFLTQFYNNRFAGAALIAGALLLMRSLVGRLMADGGRFDLCFAITFVPSLTLWCLLSDENVLPAYTVALLAALAVSIAWPSNRTAHRVCCAIGMPLLYWLIGPLAILTAVLVGMKTARRTTTATAIVTAVGLAAYVIVCMVVVTHMVPYPLWRLADGLFYYRHIDGIFWRLAVPCLVTIIVVAAAPWLRERLTERKTLVAEGAMAVVAAGLLSLCFDATRYELIEYDYLVRTQQWNAIVEKSRKATPNKPFSVCATNLALAMTNQLGGHAFEVPQHGTEGLVPFFDRSYTKSMLLGEVSYQLGMINSAQRLMFEAMEALPDYRKSCRAVKRLAETNIINGQYKVAEKYLRMLCKTVFYRSWAKSQLALLGDEAAINTHRVYGRMRRIRLENDFLFSDTEIDKICGQLFVHCRDNMMALQYLMIYPLLCGDLGKFLDYYQFVNKNTLFYNPLMCQEAMAYIGMKRKVQMPRGVVNDIVARRFKAFAQTYSMDKNSPRLEEFRNTVWYYLMKEQR